MRLRSASNWSRLKWCFVPQGMRELALVDRTDFSCAGVTPFAPLNVKLVTFTPPSSLHAPTAKSRQNRKVTRADRLRPGIRAIAYSQGVPFCSVEKRAEKLPRRDGAGCALDQRSGSRFVSRLAVETASMTPKPAAIASASTIHIAPM